MKLNFLFSGHNKIGDGLTAEFNNGKLHFIIIIND